MESQSKCGGAKAGTAGLDDSALMKALRREPTAGTPVWLMRQAGRFMPEYRDLRARVGFLDLCKNAELAAEVTVMAVEKLGVDAAIIFADILLILEPMGVGLHYSAGEGPVIDRPVRTLADIDALRAVDVGESLGFVLDAVALARRGLPAGIPLIGFAGAPFTVASYLIEGGASRHYERTKALMYSEPAAWHRLMDVLAAGTAAYLSAQIKAGAQCVQLFDSWIGCLSVDDYREFVLPHMKKLIGGFAGTAPLIHFGTGTAHLLELMREAGGDVIGLDWRVGLAEAWERVGFDVGVQGNLDPVCLLAGREEIRRQAGRILKAAAGRAGHVFNLGHGILPSTPVDNVRMLVEFVHDAGRR